MIRVCPKGHVTGAKKCPHCPQEVVKRFASMFGSMELREGPKTEPIVIAGMERGSTTLRTGFRSESREWRTISRGIRRNLNCFDYTASDIRKRKHALHQFLQKRAA